MEIIKDIFYTNKKIGKTALSSTLKNWPIIFTGLFYSLAGFVLMTILPFFWILGGLVGIIFMSAILSNYLYLIYCIIRKDRLTFQDFKDGFTVYLRKVWGVSFIGWVAMLILNTFLMPGFGRGFQPMGLGIIINFLAFALFNALPEAVYQKHYNPWESITYAVAFVRDNWIEWFIPNLVLIGVFYLLTGTLLTGIFNYQVPFRLLFSSRGIVLYLLGQIWFSYIMVYRGYLFDLLSTSNRRKRLFMREF
ncbi:hypothetical protein CACET_c10630 [Clostridium aceticum]|uniref:Uncharacterized protein n=1 Tax=Clostridium aceticum TaxID=84022 RepID=A0A0D8ID64_9CLOT|nr:hypothetical protein [Clostridium aceticum]AKL94566.1 hypothetical protein CACET_c10630 [Clostridium aceticum]KJF28233.1 hypothetical protein TZ02_02300 [Clostridium aceticum]